MHTLDCLLFMMLFILCINRPAVAGDWFGNVGLEWRYFAKPPLNSQQHRDNTSIFAVLGYQTEWDSGNNLLDISLFGRSDQSDDQRSHFDIREFLWRRVGYSWELCAGIGKVFWGVTESNHLVDIINQTDGVENVDERDKLGQQMICASLINSWGVLDLYVLPGFRERTFASVEGRLRSEFIVDSKQASYESGKQDRHIDYAVRWSHSIDEWDVGLSWFVGTNRNPDFAPLQEGGGIVLAPHYEQITQLGLDIQGTFDEWLWKLELIERSSNAETYIAATGGFEYSLYGIFESHVDLGVIAEYLYDDRGDSARTPYEDDVFLGARLVLNDEASSELLIGHIFDVEGDASFVSVEGSRRFGQASKVAIESRFYPYTTSDDLTYALRNDGYLQIEWSYYY